MTPLTVVTASTNLEQAEECLSSWQHHAAEPFSLVVVLNGPNAEGDLSLAGDLEAQVVLFTEYAGTVKAFQAGTEAALAGGAELIACLHDDLLITEPGWDEKVREHFRRHPDCGLAGFGGAVGLGDHDLYQKPYAPQQLARIGFRSNLKDAEIHGIRSTLAEKVACLDGFSQIGRRAFWEGKAPTGKWSIGGPIWQQIADLGIVHHCYDGILGCFARRYGWEAWYLPIGCHHYGGRTAVGDAGYIEWAAHAIPSGDQGFWQLGHKIWYDTFLDVLPIRV